MLKGHPKNLETLSSLLPHSLINSAHSLKDFLEYSWILFFQWIFFFKQDQIPTAAQEEEWGGASLPPHAEWS